MKSQDGYIAKEACTFPLFCLVCMVFNIYWGCVDGWPVGAIIGILFFGIVTICYVGKYIRRGRNYLRIDANGIEIKYFGMITSQKWSEIKKCEVYYRPVNAGFSFWSRDLFVIVQSGGKSEQHIFVSLSGKFCRNKSVIEAIERFGGPDVFDGQSSHRQNKYLIGILLTALIGIVIIFIILIIKGV